MLIRCAECNTVFEDSKTVCPNCGKERVVESKPETTVEQINWWTKWGNMLFGLILTLLFTATAVLLPTGIVLIFQDDGGYNIGVIFTIAGSISAVLSLFWFMIVKHLNIKDRVTKHKADKREQEEYEQLIRDFLNSNK